MPRPSIGFALATLLPALALAQEEAGPPAGYADEVAVVRYRLADLRVEAELNDGYVVVQGRNHRESVSTRLTGQRLTELRQRYEDAGFAHDVESSPLTIHYDDDPDQVDALDPSDPYAKPLVAYLTNLGRRLTTAHDPRAAVALGRPARAGRGYPSLAFDGTLLKVLYTLEGQVHVVGLHSLEYEECVRMRRDRERLVTRIPQPDPRQDDDPRPWVLEVLGASATRRLEVERFSALPPSAVALAAALRRGFDQHPVLEQPCVGRVQGDRILCLGLTLRAKQPLAGLLARLEGERVVVQAALEPGAETGAALYLIGRVGDQILPVAGPAATEGSVLAMPLRVKPQNVSAPSAQVESRRWRAGEVALTWSPVEIARLIGEPTPAEPQPIEGRVEGMLGALGGH